MLSRTIGKTKCQRQRRHAVPSESGMLGDPLQNAEGGDRYSVVFGVETDIGRIAFWHVLVKEMISFTPSCEPKVS